MLMTTRCSFYQAVAMLLILVSTAAVQAQPGATDLKWTKEGNAYYAVKSGEIVRIDLPDSKETVLVPREQLIPAGQGKPLTIWNFNLTEDGRKLLIYTNSQRVWRYDT